MRAKRQVVPDLPSDLRPETLADAYAVQHRVVDGVLTADGGHRIGYKVACTNELAQAALHIDRPVFGRLLSNTTSPSGTRLAAGQFTHRVIEAEFARSESVAMSSRSTVATREPPSPTTSTR